MILFAEGISMALAFIGLVLIPPLLHKPKFFKAFKKNIQPLSLLTYYVLILSQRERR